MAVLSPELDARPPTRAAILANIPAFPPVVLRALDLLANDNTCAAELVREISADPTLSAQTLRLANSALFAFQCEIVTVQHAIVALGFVRVQSLVMMVATANYMRAAFRTEALARCWRHTIATAVISRELARAAFLLVERAYSFGLLHDIGRLGLLVKFPDTYNEMLAEADRDAVSLLDVEQRRFGMDHCEAGRLLLERWNLPAEFRVAAGRHHDPPDGPLDMLKIVSLACRLADALGYSVVAPLQPTSLAEIREILPPEVRERFPDGEATLQSLVEAAIREQEATGSGPQDVPVKPAAAPAEYASAAEEPVWDDTGGDTEWVYRLLSITVLLVAALTILLVVGRS